MVLNTIVLLSAAAAGLGGNAAGHERQRPDVLPVLSPPAVVAGAESLLERGPVRVRFRVALVDTMDVTTAAGAAFTQLRLHPGDSEGYGGPGRKSFHVTLSPGAERTLRRVGIADLPAHFKGKVVDVQGRLHVTVLQLPESKPVWFYHIEIGALDQILSVKPVAD